MKNLRVARDDRGDVGFWEVRSLEVLRLVPKTLIAGESFWQWKELVVEAPESALFLNLAAVYLATNLASSNSLIGKHVGVGTGVTPGPSDG